MTQKELSYLEDAVGHESNMICILEESINLCEDDAISAFLKGELKGHKSLKDKMMSMLRGKVNEW